MAQGNSVQGCLDDIILEHETGQVDSHNHVFKNKVKLKYEKPIKTFARQLTIIVQFIKFVA